LRFEANVGQTDSQVKFLSRGPGFTAFLTPEETVLTLRSGRTSSAGQPGTPEAMRAGRGRGAASVIRTRWVGGNRHSQTVGEQRLVAKGSVLKGNDPARWRAAEYFARVRTKEVYSGIDLVHYGTQGGELEYDFEVRPGANPQQIRFTVAGAETVAVDAATGDLVLRTPGGELRQRKPVVYQQVRGQRRAVPGEFVLHGAERRESAGQLEGAHESRKLGTQVAVSFRIGEYDRAKTLIIDPTLSYSTYLGGGAAEQANAVAVEGNGIVYVAGTTSSTDFPTLDQYQTDQGSDDGFLVKLDTTQTGADSLLYSTYLGGGGVDEVRAVASGGNGIVYVAGGTDSANFPLLNQYQTDQTSTDAFLMKLDTTQNGAASLDYSTYLGGGAVDVANAVAAEGSGIAYVAGSTTSTDYPTLGQYQTDQANQDAFLTKIDTTQSGVASLDYSTYLGGNNTDQAFGVAAQGSGIVYLAGSTFSTDYPLLAQYQGDQAFNDGFLTKLDTTQTGSAALLYSTYLGGSSFDEAFAVTSEGAGIVYLAGYTNSTNFPTLNQYQTDQTGQDAFLTRLDTTQSGTASLLYSTYLGGNGIDTAFATAAAGSGIVYVAGQTESTNFPTLSQYQTDQTGPDGFLTRLDTTQTGSASLLFSTYLGGNGDDLARGVAAEVDGLAYVTGSTFSTNFPALSQYQTDQTGQDAFLTVISVVPPRGPSGLTLTVLTATSVRLNWTDNSSNETGFRVMRWDSASDAYSVAASPAADSITYTDTGLQPGLRYIYQIRAYNTDGNSFGSNKVQTTRPPVAPSSLTVSLATRYRAQLNWTGVTGAAYYRVERSLNGSAYVLHATVPLSTLQFRDDGLPTGTQCSYRVRAGNAGGNSPPSPVRSVTTPPDPPASPTNLTVGTVTAGSVALSWTDASGNETGFRIWRWDEVSGVYTNVHTTAANITSYTDNSVAAGKRYVYYVTAFNGTGSSGSSNKVSAFTPAL
jgi:fibronectin type 3 domain-containing protein